MSKVFDRGLKKKTLLEEKFILTYTFSGSLSVHLGGDGMVEFMAVGWQGRELLISLWTRKMAGVVKPLNTHT